MVKVRCNECGSEREVIERNCDKLMWSMCLNKDCKRYKDYSNDGGMDIIRKKEADKT